LNVYENGRKFMQMLNGKVALVTGASRGVGKGIALDLLEAGAKVYITGRSVEDMQYIEGKGIAIECDHRNDEQVQAAFAQIANEQGRLDLLVNNVWGGYENMMEDGKFTWSNPFWQQPLWRWEAMFQAGVRANFVASQFAARVMVAQGSGLIVNISFWAAQKYLSNVVYGVAKAATDKMTADMSHELRDHKVTVVSLYPGLVRTEKVMEAAQWLDLSNSESPQFIGRAVTALAADPDILTRTGKVLVAAKLAEEYSFTDIDGKIPRPLTLNDV
jgi:dehydrogenase/reductase SDR family protein 1